jgi:hypothetical protein
VWQGGGGPHASRASPESQGFVDRAGALAAPHPPARVQAGAGEAPRGGRRRDRPAAPGGLDGPSVSRRRLQGPSNALRRRRRHVQAEGPSEQGSGAGPAPAGLLLCRSELGIIQGFIRCQESIGGCCLVPGEATLVGALGVRSAGDFSLICSLP